MEHILEDLISKDLSQNFQNFQNMFHGVLGNLWRRIRGLDFDLDLIEIFLEKKIKKKKQVPSCNCVTRQIPIYL